MSSQQDGKSALFVSQVYAIFWHPADFPLLGKH